MSTETNPSLKLTLSEEQLDKLEKRLINTTKVACQVFRGSEYDEKKAKNWQVKIFEAYNHPDRIYHNLHHLYTFIESFDEIFGNNDGEKFEELDVNDKNHLMHYSAQAVFITAIAFHKFVFEVGAHDQYTNGWKSENVLKAFTDDFELNWKEDNFKGKALDLVIAVKKHYPIQPFNRFEEKFIIDLDRYVLAKPWGDDKTPGTYKFHVAQLAAEYGDKRNSWTWKEWRIRQLKDLQGGTIYFTEYFKKHYLETAKENIKKELEELDPYFDIHGASR